MGHTIEWENGRDGNLIQNQSKCVKIGLLLV